MRRKIFLGLITAMSAICLCFGLAACNSGNSLSAGRRVPVYQGMSIDGAAPVNTASLLAAGGNAGDSGNHYGWYKDKDKDVDQDDPFEGEDVEDAVEDSLKVEGAAQKIYYAVPNEDIFITIHIDNPDSFEIMSFTLNGEKYSSYMFEAGSNMENIVLKKNVGDVSGIVEYTIDAIKYIDGTEIKDVLLDGDKTVRAGIRTENQVTATAEETAGFDEISLSITVRDKDGLIAFSEGELKAVLYDGESLVAEEKIEVGKSEVTFGGLELAKLYQYAVIACYDDLASGKDWHVLYKKAIHTETAVIFDDIAITKESISFSFLWHEDAPATGISSLRLIDSGRERELDPKADKAEGLLSNHSYTLAATYLFKDAEKEIKFDFTTEAYTMPEVELSISDTEQESFSFTVNVTDTDAVGAITKVELLHGDDEPQDLGTNASGTAEHLLSNNAYIVSVTYTYDLNDGNGPQTLTETAETLTLPKAVPEIEVTISEEGQEEFTYTVAVTDTDEVGEITKVELLHDDDEPQDLGTEATGTAEHLLSNNNYTVSVTYTYNLNDGNGPQTITGTAEAHTMSKAVPEIEVTISDEGQEEFSYTVIVTDTDEVGEITKVELLHGDDAPQDLSTESTGTAEHLLSNNAYTVSVTYTYNLNDGNAPQTITKTAETHTMSKAVPTVELSNIARTTSEISFDVSVDDPDDVSEFEKYELLEGAAVQATHTEEAQKAFGELESYTRYIVKVTYTYDLNDGAGKQYATAEHAIYTMPVFEATKTTCINTSAVLEGGTIVLNTAINNPSKAIASEVNVNGIWYPVDPTTNTENIRVQIINSGQFRGGETLLAVEEVKAKIGEEEFLFALCSGNETTCLVNGNIEAISLKVVDENGKELEYSYVSNEIYLQVSFDNPTGYQIDSVKINDIVYGGDAIIYVDANTIRVQETLSYHYGCANYELAEFTYFGEKVPGKTKTVENISYRIPILQGSTEDVVEIHTAADLKNMNEGKHYKLMNDIDLMDTPWDIPGDFNGYFDGGNFTIRNMRVVDDFENKDVYFGLFTEAMGTIKNLNIEDVLIIVNVTGGSCYYGGIAAQGSYLNVKNVHASGEVFITTSGLHIYGAGGILGGQRGTVLVDGCINSTNITIVSAHGERADAGGIVGEGNSSYLTFFKNCYNTGTISGYHSGGIVGSDGQSAFINCHNTGTISSGYSSGGIVGDGGQQLTFKNCYNTGTISGGYYAGGIVGNSIQSTLTNCYNTGTISVAFGGSGRCAYSGGIVGDGYNATITNCYNTGTISGGDYAGGIVGEGNQSTLTNCYNTGMVSGGYAGGIAGGGLGTITITITNCFYIAEGKNLNFTDYGTVQFTDCYHFSEGSQGVRVDSKEALIEKMKELFDENVWVFGEDGEFPTLRVFAEE